MITDENVQAPLVDPTERALSRLVITASADAVFGEPVVNGDTTVIPCSEVFMGMGMGSGRMTRRSARSDYDRVHG